MRPTLWLCVFGTLSREPPFDPNQTKNFTCNSTTPKTVVMDSLRPDCNFDDFPSTVVMDSQGNPCPFTLLREPPFDLYQTNIFTCNSTPPKTVVMDSSRLDCNFDDFPPTVAMDSHGNPCPFKLLREPPL